MIVDIIILVVVVLAILLGIRRGLMVSLVNFFSIIIALVVAFMLYKPVGEFIIDRTDIGNDLKQIIEENIPMNGDEIMQIGEDSNLPKGMREFINKQAQDVNTSKDDAIEKISTQLSTEIIMIISFIGTFIVVRIALIVVKVVSKIIAKLPIINQADHIGGAIVGAVQGIIIVYFAFAIISTISPVLENTKILQQIDNSFVGKMMYNDNIIMNRLKK